MPGPVEVSRPRMLTRPLVLVFVSSFGFSTSFYLMLSVVPLYATSVGAGGAGAALAREDTEATSRLQRRWGHQGLG
jgi:uncharacterized BrkB/YihY/UPF0761 family membrane protein